MTYAQRINAALRHVPAWPIYIVPVALPAWLVWQGMTGGLGAEPINALERQLGLWALKFLLAVLAVTPLRNLTGINLVRYRRAIGLTGFYLLLAHLSVWVFLDVQIVSQMWANIIKRPYITIGMAGLILMIPVAITSNNWSIRKMGPLKWRKWHLLTYPAILLGGIHYVMLAKTWQQAPLTYLLLILILLGTRIRLPKRLLPA